MCFCIEQCEVKLSRLQLDLSGSDWARGGTLAVGTWELGYVRWCGASACSLKITLSGSTSERGSNGRGASGR